MKSRLFFDHGGESLFRFYGDGNVSAEGYEIETGVAEIAPKLVNGSSALAVAHALPPSRSPSINVLTPSKPLKAARRLINKRKLKEHNIFAYDNSITSLKAVAAYKSLRTRVMQRLLAMNQNSFMVVGPTQNVGKTLTAINLSVEISKTVGKRVILVDLDLRSPSIHNEFGFVPYTGVADIAKGRASLEDSLVDPGMDGLLLLPGTKRFENSSELLTSREMLELYKTLHAMKNTIVVYDTPPVLGCDDVTAISPFIPVSLLVVRQNHTQKKEFISTMKMIGHQSNLLGVTLNASSEVGDSYYY